MDPVTPGDGLIIWTFLVSLVVLIPLVLTIIIFRSSRFILTEKLLWVLLIWLIPIVGAFVYIFYSTSNSKAR